MFGCSVFWVIWSKIHHSSSKIGGTHEKHFVWTPSLGFGHPVLVILSLKKLSDETQKWKQISLVFKFDHPWLSGSSVNRLPQWALRTVHCPISTQHSYDRWSWNLIHFSSSKFFSSKISLFSLPSLNLFSFSLPYWHSQRASSMAPQSMFEDWTRPEKWVCVWRTTPHRSSEPGLNLHRWVYLSVIVSIPLSPFPRCNIISQVQ